MTERCPWCGDDSLYQQYHDQEWGVPSTDDRHLFEFLILESAQAGLNWLTILRKREGYRQAFAQFDPAKVARFTPKHIETLLSNPDIVRNRSKVESAVTNAQLFLDIQEQHGSFSRYLWQFVDGRPIQNRWQRLAEVPATTALSDRISKDMKKRGFRFFGSTICYAYLQAIGVVNDHLLGCHRYLPCTELGQQVHVNYRAFRTMELFHSTLV